jgi:hypothetical protein
MLCAKEKYQVRKFQGRRDEGELLERIRIELTEKETFKQRLDRCQYLQLSKQKKLPMALR